jgi:hypothetical protein
MLFRQTAQETGIPRSLLVLGLKLTAAMKLRELFTCYHHDPDDLLNHISWRVAMLSIGGEVTFAPSVSCRDHEEETSD